MTRDVAGRFLVATPMITGPPFERSVVLMIEHDTTGAIGVVVNLPTNIPVADVLPTLTVPPVEPAIVFIGGPVSTETAVVLGRSDSGPFTVAAPGTGMGIVDLADPPADLDGIRVYAGYSGWSPGQLERELDEGSWWVLPASADAVFAGEPERLWHDVVAAAPGSIRFHAHFPDDPSLN